LTKIPINIIDYCLESTPVLAHSDRRYSHFPKKSCLQNLTRNKDLIKPVCVCRFQAAATYFSGLRELGTRSASASNLAMSHARQLNWPSALAAKNRSLVIDRTNPKALFYRALALERLGRLEEALGTYRDGVLQLPGCKPMEEGLREAEVQLAVKRRASEDEVTMARIRRREAEKQRVAAVHSCSESAAAIPATVPAQALPPAAAATAARTRAGAAFRPSFLVSSAAAPATVDGFSAAEEQLLPKTSPPLIASAGSAMAAGEIGKGVTRRGVGARKEVASIGFGASWMQSRPGLAAVPSLQTFKVPLFSRLSPFQSITDWSRHSLPDFLSILSKCICERDSHEMMKRQWQVGFCSCAGVDLPSVRVSKYNKPLSPSTLASTAS
jgi:hypothetical protein